MTKSKKLSGGDLKRIVGFDDPTDIHKLRMIGLLKDKNLVEFEDKDKKIKSDELNILYVIDMQNDFIKPDGNFSVHGGKTVLKELIPFIKTHKDKFSKIIFSRDYHEEEHCGFFPPPAEEGKAPPPPRGIHPPHCVQGSQGGNFDDEIKDLLENTLLKKSSKDYNKTEIVFKAMQMESFGASKATKKSGKWYKTHTGDPDGCMHKCDAMNENKCLNLTGGFQIKESRPKTHSIGDSIRTKDLTRKYDIENVVGEFPDSTYNIYITGLAGCHCVSETATNIADYFISINNTNYQIYIIEDLTRYAFVPLFVGPQDFTEEEIEKRLSDDSIDDSSDDSRDDSRDDLSLYIFEKIDNKFKLLTKEEVKDYKTVIANGATGPADPNALKYYHYLVSLKETITKYLEYGDDSQRKIKLLMNPKDKELSKTMRDEREKSILKKGNKIISDATNLPILMSDPEIMETFNRIAGESRSTQPVKTYIEGLRKGEDVGEEMIAKNVAESTIENLYNSLQKLGYFLTIIITNANAENLLIFYVSANTKTIFDRIVECIKDLKEYLDENRIYYKEDRKKKGLVALEKYIHTKAIHTKAGKTSYVIKDGPKPVEKSLGTVLGVRRASTDTKGGKTKRKHKKSTKKTKKRKPTKRKNTKKRRAGKLSHTR